MLPYCTLFMISAVGTGVQVSDTLVSRTQSRLVTVPNSVINCKYNGNGAIVFTVLRIYVSFM